MNRYLDVAPEVQQAVAEGRPVVALESTIISHGMPYPQNVETALNVEKIIRENGADLLSQLDMAYAMTVHKAQGSEYRAVVLVSAPAAPNLLVRGVLYTAITRARELLVMVGDDAIPGRMAENDRRTRRYSGLRRRLKQGGPSHGHE